jgi:inosine-uridine nucleoside N-ribohydrolase
MYAITPKTIVDFTTLPLIVSVFGFVHTNVVSLKPLAFLLVVGFTLYVGYTVAVICRCYETIQTVYKFCDDVLDETRTLEAFEESLDSAEMIERFDLDRPDPDNFAALLVRLGQRRSKRHNKTNPLHVVLVGRRFSSKLSPAVLNAETGLMEIEVWEKEKEAKIVSVEPKEIGKYVKQAAWEAECWDEDEEELLMGLYAAHVRACLHDFVEGDEYLLYHGGVARLAGLSSAVHSLDFEFLRDPKCESFDLTPAADLASFNQTWRSMTEEERADHFLARACAPSEEQTKLLHLTAFTRFCMARPNVPIKLTVASPLTAVATTFKNKPALAERVAYVAAMSGAWDGSQNLLGTCFNNAVDYEASKTCFGGDLFPNLFPNARILLVPTETCKMGPFALSAETIRSLTTQQNATQTQTHTQKAMADGVEQWTGLKRGVPQALFDVVTLFPLTTFVAHAAIVPVKVTFGKNKYAEGTIYEDLGMGLTQATQNENDASSVPEMPGKLSASSPFPPGVYATERVFGPGCAAAFTDMIAAALNAV